MKTVYFSSIYNSIVLAFLWKFAFMICAVVELQTVMNRQPCTRDPWWLSWASSTLLFFFAPSVCAVLSLYDYLMRTSWKMCFLWFNFAWWWSLAPSKLLFFPLLHYTTASCFLCKTHLSCDSACPCVELSKVWWTGNCVPEIHDGHPEHRQNLAIRSKEARGQRLPNRWACVQASVQHSPARFPL